jgi:hypothetical protein
MSVSLPSTEAIIVDIPEVKKFVPTFQYNFFVPDESKTDVTQIPRNILEKPSESFDAPFIDFITLRIPRFVKFAFVPVVLQPITKKVTDEDIRSNAGTDRIIPKGIIKDNLKKIIDEDQFADNSFVSVNFSDQSIDVKLQQFVSGSISSIYADVQQRENTRSNAAKAAAQAAADAAAARLQARKDVAATVGAFIFKVIPKNNNVTITGKTSIANIPSQTQILKKVDSVTPTEVKFNFLSRAMIQPAQSGAFFYENSQLRKNESLERLKNVSIKTQFNAKFMKKLVRGAMTNPTVTFGSDLVNLYNISKDIEKNAIQRTTLSITEDQYKTYANPYAVSAAVSTTATSHSAFRIVGYIIDRYEQLTDGSLKTLTPIVLENPYLNSAVDLNVRYGATYAYAIRTIAEFTIPSINDDTHELVIAKLLISSKATKPFYVQCHENVPPPSPSDFNCHWNYELNRLGLTWSFPPNTQRDIKKFQIFRRKTVQEPFQLIRMYNFDDSEVQAVDNEQVPAADTVLMTEPLLYFVDDEFDKDSKYIYALCSIDAHGLTSNYSEQFELSFDRFKNRVNKEIISSSGAPKSYPNMYLVASAFVDVIESDNHSQVKVYFMPDYMSLYDDNHHVQNVVETDKTAGAYRFQFINVDLQQQAVLNINITDKRTYTDIQKELYQRSSAKLKGHQ